MILFLERIKQKFIALSLKSRTLYSTLLKSNQGDDRIDEMYSDIAQTAFLKPLTHREKVRLVHIAERESFVTGELIFQETQASDCFYIIMQGDALVYRSSENERGEKSEHIIAKASPGSIIGEMGLIDSAPRSASVRALTDIKALKVDFSRVHGDPVLSAAITRCIATVSVMRLRHTNDTVVASIKRQLEESVARNVLGSFMITLFWLLGLYTLSLTSLISLKTYIPNTTPLFILLMVVLSAALIFTAKRTGLPMSVFGLTMRNWRGNVIEAVKLSLLFCLLITLLKLGYMISFNLLENTPLFHPFAFANFYQQIDLKTYFLTVLAYSAVCPMQELLGRGMLQSTFYNFLPGKEVYRTWNSILLSNLLFAMLHSHLSLAYALISFFPGLCWGWLYHRQKSIIGVSLSHIMIGVYALFVLGPP